MAEDSAKPAGLLLDELEAFAYLEEVFPAVRGRFEIIELAPMRARVRRRVGEADIRPGGTVSGPAMFDAADCGFYIAALGMIGREALAVTTNAAINFLNKPAPRDLVCEARILKLGKLLVTGDVLIWSDGADGPNDRPVAHATLTYAVPPRRTD